MAARRKKSKKKEIKPMAFSAINYKLLGLGALLILIGFTIMRLENEVYGVISLYIAPVIIMAGYITVVVAILKRAKPGSEQNKTTASA